MHITDGLPTDNLMYFAMFSSGLTNAVIDRHLSSSEFFVPQNDFVLSDTITIW